MEYLFLYPRTASPLEKWLELGSLTPFLPRPSIFMGPSPIQLFSTNAAMPMEGINLQGEEQRPSQWKGTLVVALTLERWIGLGAWWFVTSDVLQGL